MDAINEFLQYLSEMDLTNKVIGLIITLGLTDFTKELVFQFTQPIRTKVSEYMSAHHISFFGEKIDLGKLVTLFINAMINILFAFTLFLLFKRGVIPLPTLSLTA